MAMGAVLGTALGTDMMTIKGLVRRSIAAGFTLDVVRDEVLSRVLDEKEVWGSAGWTKLLSYPEICSATGLGAVPQVTGGLMP